MFTRSMRTDPTVCCVPTEQGTWIAYGCVLCLSGETYLTRTMTSATGYNLDMSWQTVTADHQPSACAMQRIN